MSSELSETAEAILLLLKDSPLGTDAHGRFMTIDLLEYHFGENRMNKVREAINELLKKDYVELVEDEDDVYKLTPYGARYLASPSAKQEKVLPQASTSQPASLSNADKQKFEALFGMGSGYVLDFSNASFQDFIMTSVGIDVDDESKYVGSKANKLRTFWNLESEQAVGAVLSEMLERWMTNKLISQEKITDSEQKLYDACLNVASRLAGGNSPKVSNTEKEFLARDLGRIDVSALNIASTLQGTIEQRLDEAAKCLSAKAPLAVIFLCGSTLEGLLLDYGNTHTKDFNQATSAPTDKNGKPYPLKNWNLNNLIDVSRELDVIGEDVKKHAHAVRDFRNYIHPREQQADNFNPRMFTAEIAYKVLQASVVDLGNAK